jgi:hypothetical protein
MRLLGSMGLVIAALGCSGATTSNGPSLVGTWVSTNAAGTTGAGFSLKSDGTYVLDSLVETSPTTGNAEVEIGTYTSTSTTITMTPKQWSCPSPDPVSTVTYTFNGNNLVVTTSSGVVTFNPDTAAPSSTIAITDGCFAPSGTFTAAPIAVVTN